MAFPPSNRFELIPKANARLFDARAAMKPRKTVVGRALRGGNADAATSYQGAVEFRVIVPQKQF